LNPQQRKLKREKSDESSADEEDEVPAKKLKKKKKLVKKPVDSSDDEEAPMTSENPEHEPEADDPSENKRKVKKNKAEDATPEEDVESMIKTLAELNAHK